MKKTVTVFLLMLLLAGLLMPVSAAESLSAVVSADNQAAERGDTINFTVTISGDAACTQYGLLLSYDANVFEVVRGTCSVSGTVLSNFSADKGFVVLYASSTIPEGTVGTFIMKVKDNAAYGTYHVGFQTSGKNGTSDVPISINSVGITIAGEETTPPTEHKHTYSDKWSSDKSQHWHECTGCGDKKDVAKHTPGTEATEKDPQRCTDCGYVLKAALGHTHSYGTKWIYDDIRHWHVCDCGAKSDMAAHTWNSNGICSKCSAKKPQEETKPEETTEPQATTEETTAETTETTGATRPTIRPEWTYQPEQETTEPSQPVEEPGNDTQWMIGGIVLAVLVVLVTVAYFFIAKKRQG